jgi:hypothetical protein
MCHLNALMHPVPEIVPSLHQNLRLNMNQQLIVRARGKLLQERRNMNVKSIQLCNKSNCCSCRFWKAAVWLLRGDIQDFMHYTVNKKPENL